MKKFLLMILACLFCISCGVKSEPEYKSKNNHNKVIQII